MPVFVTCVTNDLLLRKAIGEFMKKTIFAFIFLLYAFDSYARIIWQTSDVNFPKKVKSQVEFELQKLCPRLMAMNNLEIYHVSTHLMSDGAIYTIDFRGQDQDPYDLKVVVSKNDDVYKVDDIIDYLGCQ